MCNFRTLAIATICVTGAALSAIGAEIVAELGGDFQAAMIGETTQTVNAGAGIADTAGSGSWDYLQAEGGGTNSARLIWNASPGDSGSPGYGSTVLNSDNLNVPAISKNIIRTGSGSSAAPSNAVNVYPGEVNPTEVIARWTAGQTGLMNIAGSVRRYITQGQSIVYAVRVNGTDQVTSVSVAGREDGFNLLTNVTMGDTIDLVVGPNGNFINDESQAQLRVTQLTGKLVANLGGDYNESGQPISATGSGTWQYFASDNPNIDATANEMALTVGTIGAGGTGYGGGGNGLNLPAINDGIIFGDGEPPLPNELVIHPGDDSNINPTTQLEDVVMRWTAGNDEGGVANITGNIRNNILFGDSIEFQILVDGAQVFDLAATDLSLPLSYFDVSSVIAAGSTVDFVVSNNGNAFADESVLAAFITVQSQTVPEPTSIAIWSLIGLAGLAYLRFVRQRGHGS